MTPAPQALEKSTSLMPANTADLKPAVEPKQSAISEPAQVKSEDTATAIPVSPPAIPGGVSDNLSASVAAAVPAASLTASAPPNGEVKPTLATNPAAIATPERKGLVPIQMSPEAALSVTLAASNTPTVKAPATSGVAGKSSSRLPAPKSGTRPATTAPGVPKAEPAGLPQQLTTQHAELRGPGVALQQLQPRPPESAQYSGEAIDLKVKDLDLVDFFRMMAEISGLNISVDPDVGGKITMSMGAVPWDQIFDLALVTHRLEKKIDGNVVRVAKKDTFQAEETAKKTMRQAVEAAQDTQYMSFRLNYADAKVLSESLKDQLSNRGQVIFDERTNTVIVSDLPKKILDVSQLVKTLDVPEPQVIIESRVVQATRSFAREIGVTLGFVAGNGERVSVGAPSMAFPQIPGLLNNNINLGATRQNGVLGVKVGNLFDTFALDAAISAGEQKGIAKLLSEPKVTAQNNREATIRQGVRFPVQVVQNNTVSVIFQDAALTLKVTPKITDAGTVLLNLRVENNVADFTRSVNGIPSIQTSESETRVLIPNGGTTVIGGILVDEDRDTDDKVPGMASIPIFGHLFKKRSTEKRTQEVLFFVTPRIDR
jgi:type IV pilus secretin PilQ/predicted competence protein